MTTRLRHSLSPTVALLLATTLAACGGGSRGSTSGGSATKLLADTFGAHQSVHSGRLNVAVDLNLQGVKNLSGPVTFKISGPFNGHGKNVLPDFNLSVLLGQGSGTSLSSGLVSVNNKAYIQFAGNNYVLPDSVFASFKSSYLQSTARAAQQKGSTFAAFGIDPRQWLTGARTVGTDQVGGSQATHVTAGVDVARFLTDVNKLLGRANQLGVNGVANTPTSISPAAQAALAASVKSATVDVWTGTSDRILRRLKIAVSLDVPPANRTAVRGLTSGTIGLDLQLSDLNKPQQIVPPARAQPLANLLGAVGQSGTGSATTTTTPNGTGTTGGSVSAPPAYLSCIQKAAGNVTAIQACSSLLGH